MFFPSPVGSARHIRSWTRFAKSVGNVDRDLDLIGILSSAFPARDDGRALRLGYFVGPLLPTLPGFVRETNWVPWVGVQNYQDPELDHCIFTS